MVGAFLLPECPLASCTTGMHDVTPSQCRMARAALDWTRKELALRSGLGVETVYRFETGRKPHYETVLRLRSTFTAAGVVLVRSGEGEGVLLRHPPMDPAAPG